MTPEQSALQYAHRAARRTTHYFTDDFGNQMRCIHFLMTELDGGPRVIRGITEAPEQKLAGASPGPYLVYDDWGSILPLATFD